MDIGGGLVTNAATGLPLDVRTRSLVVHPANSFTDRGRSNVVGVGPDTVEPTAAGGASRLHGAGQVLDDAETLCPQSDSIRHGSARGVHCRRPVNAEDGYGLPVCARFVGAPRRARLVGLPAQRRENPMHGDAENGPLGEASIGR